MDGRRALVVGNSDGIGLALTRRLLEAGWAVQGVSRRAAPLDGVPYRHAVLDVTAADYAEQLGAVQAVAGPFDLCVYCAGIGEQFDAADLARDLRVFQVNLLGAVRTAGVVLPPMIAAGRGHLIGLSSIGDGVWPDALSYAASKAGLSSYLEGLGLALRPRGVAVTNVRFGFVDTKMAKARSRPFLMSADRAAQILMGVIRRRPMRVSLPRRMAALVWLLGLVTRLRIALGRSRTPR